MFFIFNYLFIFAKYLSQNPIFALTFFAHASMPFLSQIKQELHKIMEDASQVRILVALSGGADSVCLALVLKELGYTIGIVHCNFGLRGEESDAEEDFVRNLAKEWQLELFVRRFDTKKEVEKSGESLQVVARKLRYAYFEEVMQQEKYDFCATAHHANDQAETLLLHLIKGSANQVMKGIPLQREKYIRPLLHVSKKGILAYLEEKNYPYKTDSSNLKNDYQRNFLRNKVIPQMEEINPSFVDLLNQKYAFYQLQSTFIQSVVKEYLPKDKHLIFAPFVAKYGDSFLPILILSFLQLHKISGHKALEICELANKKTGKIIEGKENKIIRTREGIAIIEEQGYLYHTINEIYGNLHFSLGNWEIGVSHSFWGTIQKPNFSQAQTFYLDKDKIRFPLTFRSPILGDKIAAYGLNGKKNISDIFTDNKYPVQHKLSAFVIEDAIEIIALSHYRIAENVKIDAHTSNILVIKYHQKQE